MTQDRFYCILNTKEEWWVLFGKIKCQIMGQLHPKRLISWHFLIIIIVSILEKCCYFHTKSVQLYAKCM